MNQDQLIEKLLNDPRVTRVKITYGFFNDNEPIKFERGKPLQYRYPDKPLAKDEGLSTYEQH